MNLLTEQQRENLKALVEALKSGEYEQGTGCLRIKNCFCAEGVACEVYRLRTNEGKWERADNPSGIRYFRFNFLPLGYAAPSEVKDYFGLDTITPHLGHTLIDLNEGQNGEVRLSFSEIGSLIKGFLEASV